MSWLIGETARIRLDAFDEANAALDLSDLRLTVKPPGGGANVIYQYGIDAALVRDAAGRYRLDLPLTAAGTWRWRWSASGPLATALESGIDVQPSKVI